MGPCPTCVGRDRGPRRLPLLRRQGRFPDADADRRPELTQHGIQVNAIAPGTIKTTITPWYDTQDAVDYCRRLVPAHRFGRTEELAGAAVYLASDESSYTTGATIVVDGGLMIQ